MIQTKIRAHAEGIFLQPLSIILLLLTTAIGCGGGGGSSSTPANVAPDAQFTMSTNIGSFPLLVVFDASGSSDSDGTIEQYDWQFGDGTTGRGAVVQHTYSTTGTYSAQLTVTDNGGLNDALSQEIDVKPQYSISGSISLADHVVTDSDINDVNVSPVSNNSFTDAQSVPTPCSVSGYVNRAGTGPRGALWQSGDPNDYYRVSLTEGMSIILYMAEDPNEADLNLYLYDDQFTLVDASMSTDSIVDSLTSPQQGVFYVRVEATVSASVYTLTIGQTNSPTVQSLLRLSDDFVPGEVLVRVEGDDSNATPALNGGATGISAMGFSTQAGLSGQDKLLRQSETVNKRDLFTRLGIESSLNNSLSPGNADLETIEKMETLWMVRALRKQPGIQFAEPNYIRKPFRVPNDTYYAYQWHYPMIHLPEAWEITIGSSDVIVAVVDTGVLLDHPDLNGQLVNGYDFISDPESALDGDGIDDDPDDPGDGDIGGSTFHGTHVAGTIAALSNNTSGVTGVAWNARIMPLRALGKGGGTSSDILQAVKYAAGLITDAGVMLDEPVDIINLSLGGESYSQIEAAVYAEAREQGVIIIAAAGNKGSSVPMYPAGYDGVVSVNAVTIDESIASYSNYGITIDVAAPGGSSADLNGDGYMDGVLSTFGDDSNGDIEMGYAFSTGTSMATPHVSGVVALMKGLYPGLTPNNFDSLLAGGYLTQDIGDSGRDDKFGYGLIDAYKAVIVANEGNASGSIPAILSVSPTALNFGASLTTAEIKVKNGGSGTLVLTDILTNAAWLTITAGTDVDSDTGLGTYTANVDREGLSDGTYTTTISFVSETQQIDVQVVMQVAAATTTTNGGYPYVLLLEPDTLTTVNVAEGPFENGCYSFEFSSLSYGDTYVIYAGTDPDNDGFICEDGEACGAYISLDQPVTLEIVGDLTGLDFTTDLVMNLPTASTGQSSGSGFPLQRLIDKKQLDLK